MNSHLIICYHMDARASTHPHERLQMQRSISPMRARGLHRPVRPVRATEVPRIGGMDAIGGSHGRASSYGPDFLSRPQFDDIVDLHTQPRTRHGRLISAGVWCWTAICTATPSVLSPGHHTPPRSRGRMFHCKATAPCDQPLKSSTNSRQTVRNSLLPCPGLFSVTT